MRTNQEQITRPSPSTILVTIPPKSVSRLTRSAGDWLALSLTIMLCLAHMACGKSKKLGPGSTRPNPVKDFQAVVLGSDTVRLTWKAPSGDSPAGRAAGYDIRQSAIAITDSTFSSADTVGTPPPPGQPQASEHCYATEIPGSATRYFAIRASNQAGEWSPLAEVGPVETIADTIPPGRVMNLRIVEKSDSTITLHWTATGDDGLRGRAATAEIRYIGGVLTNANWEQAHTPRLTNTRVGPAGTEQEAVVGGFTPRTPLEVAIETRDEAGNHPPPSNSVQVILKGKNRDWAIRPDGAGDAPTIQAGIDSSMNDDTIRVTPGTYYENPDLRGKSLILVGTNRAADTILDGSRGGTSVLRLSTEGHARATIRGLTVRGGIGYRDPAVPGRVGGGIYARNYDLQIDSNIIRDNAAEVYGGGMDIAGATGGNGSGITISRNIIEHNTSARQAGGVSVIGTLVRVTNNVFRENRASFDAGGLYYGILEVPGTIDSNSFIGNEAGDHGAGCVIQGVSPAGRIAVQFNVFYANVGRGFDGRETGAGGGMWIVQAHGSVSHNTFVSNEGYGDTIGGVGGVLMESVDSGMELSWNIIVDNIGSGIGCHDSTGPVVINNLLWNNSGGDLGAFLGRCPESWSAQQVYGDPRFCSPAGLDFTVSRDSPALTEKGVIGAVTNQTCGQGKAVSGESW